ncbi:3-isopropylmalate dehydratase small subunit [Lederbergia galactosidilytica]|uniref:3-isopropylmalate dehydratase small subunit n=1 Tax=Lederbergia galactosidilytica TaxID=217031 RepID=A0A0Q9XWZ0_9BACI|nr:3-isopropylmalate dehydratase small subunit [Lederbergia galactosidilytica]KRG12273.1 isopropylmalate isomerase [Virgibacillus soli]KRG13071.1 isopropylmalate isomerase [Lederbergia galactosidilytica]MBP1913924.1 3-isopropylmalate/(R)-2-methylmalate dehydratase small subunit [Lederbergia galactosidilytica]OAK73963.1 isopropylmalate isomerase [Lederbergia galactosidilytica]
MKPIKEVTSVLAPLERSNVDTDQIIPKQFLKRIERTGFGKYLFYHWRFHDDGTEKAEFILNKPEYQGTEILVARENFGCGSSREHAPWALGDYGFRVVIATSFADIFYNNCLKNGILAVQLSADQIEELLAAGKEKSLTVTVSLEDETITTADGVVYSFTTDPYRREMLLNGWDEIALTLQLEDEIAKYENAQA